MKESIFPPPRRRDRMQWTKRSETLRRIWYRYSRNSMSVVGLVLLIVIVAGAIFAPYVTPYPKHAGAHVDFKSAKQPPSFKHLLGTDLVGRDVFSRVIFGYRYSLVLGIVVLAIAVPIGVTVGLIAGYHGGRWVDTLLMRITDVFMSVPPLLLALAITAVLPANLTNAMLAVTAMWWPPHARIIYGMTRSICSEPFVLAAESIGAGRLHILFREILPNCAGAIFAKITIDMGLIILIGAVLSFVGLGVQPPKPGLGTMVAEGAKYLPSIWWQTVFPGIGIVLVVYAFNLMGDGMTEALAAEEA